MFIVKDDPRRLVREGYDRIAPRYLAWNVENVKGSPAEDRFVPMLLRTLPVGGRVLDLGCGNGVPRTRALAACFHVIGADLSLAQLKLTRAHVPEAVLVRADMSRMHLRPASLDAVVAFYSIIHVPREDHGELFQRVAAWLRPGGAFLAVLGTEDLPASVEEDWLGAPMYWSGYDAATNLRLVQEAGFALIETEIATQLEDGQNVEFLWVFGRNLRS